MSSPELQRVPSPQPSRPWTQALLTVLIAVTAVYLVTNHWLHILDALPYLWVVLMMSMHLFMHRGHGGHGGHSHAGHGDADHSHAGHGDAGHGSAGRPDSGGGTGHVH